MDFRRQIHSILGFALIPSISFFHEMALPVLILWLLLWPASVTQLPKKWDPPLVLFLFACLVVLIVHVGSTPLLVLSILAGLSTCWIILRITSTQSATQSRSVSAGAALSSWALFITAITEAWTSGFGQIHPATYHPNLSAALAIALAGSTALGLTTVDNSRKHLSWQLFAHRWFYVGGIVVAIPTIVLTGSRSGLLGAAGMIGAVAVVITCQRLFTARPRIAATAPLVMLVMLFLSMQVLAMAPTERARQAWETLYNAPIPGLDTGSPIDDITVRFSELLNPRSASGTRVANWTVARQLIADRPLLGYGYVDALQAYQLTTRDRVLVPNAHPHNSGLMLALQGGALLLAAASLLALAYLYRLSWISLYAGHHRWPAIIILGMIFGLLFADTFDLLILNWQILVPVLATTLSLLTTSASLRIKRKLSSH